MKQHVPATQIKPGDKVTYCGASFVASDVVFEAATSGLVRVGAVGSYPQFIAPERTVEVDRRSFVPEKPYVVLTRFYRASGFCEKRRHTFATRKAQQSFVGRTKRVVTFTN